MEYNLFQHGDFFERNYWFLLAEDFPNYQIFWRDFVVPLTGRDADGSIGLRNGIHPLLEEMAMTHYSIFNHVVFAQELKAKREQGLHGYFYFEAILFHLSASTEMIDRFLLALAQIDSTIQNEEFVRKLSWNEFQQKVNNYWAVAGKKGASPKESPYDEQFAKFLKTGQSATLVLHNMDEAVNTFVRRISLPRAAFRSWKKAVQPIRAYRNVITHNPKLGQWIEPNSHVLLIPKHTSLKKYQRWSDLNKFARDDFVEQEICINTLIQNLVNAANNMWEQIISYMRGLVTAEKYREMARGDDSEGSGWGGILNSQPPFAPAPGSATPTLPSGFKTVEWNLTSRSQVATTNVFTRKKADD